MLKFLGVVNFLMLAVLLGLLYQLFFKELGEEAIFKLSKVGVVLLALIIILTGTIYFSV